MIDSQVRLSGIWRRGGVTLGSNGRVNASAITMIRPSVYQTTLTISPLSNTLDDGQYSCQSAILSDPFILYADASQQLRVRIGGRHDHVVTNNVTFFVLRIFPLFFSLQNCLLLLFRLPMKETQLLERITPLSALCL